MTETFRQFPVEVPNEESNEAENGVYDYIINDKGELRIEGFGDINDPHNDDARTEDESGQTKIAHWLDVVQDEKGQYIKARFKDRDAYNKYMNERFAKGRDMTNKLHSENVHRLVRESLAQEKPESVTLKKFTDILSDYIDAVPWLRSQILGWDLRQQKPGKSRESRFRLAVIYENEWAKNGKKKKVYIGTYEEIVEKFENDLDRLDSNLKVVDL